MIQPLITASPRGFALAFVLFVAPAPVIATLLVLLSLLHPGDVYRSAAGPVLAFIQLLFLAPLLETVLLIAPTMLALRLLRRRWLACVLGSMPVVLLHVPDGWQKAAVVSASFLWGAYCYATLTDQGASFRTRFWFLAGIHALANLLAFALGMAIRGM